MNDLQAVLDTKSWLVDWAELDPQLLRFLAAPASAWGLLPETPENLLQTLQPQAMHAFDWIGETGTRTWAPAAAERAEFFHFFYADPVCWFYFDDAAGAAVEACSSCLIPIQDGGQTWLVHIE